MINAFWILIAAWAGYLVGWRSAHLTVALECERLGAFFVGKKVFKCSSIESGKKGDEVETHD